MFSQLVEYVNTIDLPTNETLLRMVPLCKRRVVLFFSSQDAICYDMFEAKIISKKRLEAKVFKAKALTENEIVCTLVNGALSLLDVSKSFEQRVLPPSTFQSRAEKSGSNISIFDKELLAFKESGSFLVQLNTTNLAYFPRVDGKIANVPMEKTLKHSDQLVQPVNDKDSLAVFSQYPEANRRWTICIYNFADNFREQSYGLDNPIFQDKALVQAVRQISDGRYVIVVNAENCCKFAVFTPKEESLQEFQYRPDSFMECMWVINTKTQVMLVPRMYRTMHKGVYYDNIVDVVSLETGQVFHQLYATLLELEEGWEDNYLVSYSRPGIRTMFKLVTKQAIYIKCLKNLKTSSRYGQSIYEKVMCLLQGGEEHV